MKKSIFLPFCLVVLLFSCQKKIKTINTQTTQNKYLDVAYNNQSEAQKLDIYLPDKGENHPVIVAIHGGAFLFGDKQDDQLTPMLEGLQRGYAVVSINYRLSGEAIFPAQIQDVKAAIRFIKANAAQYHIDSSRVAVWGGSAGGYLSALAGTTSGNSVFDTENMPNRKATSDVKAVVDWFGPIDFLQLDEQFKASGKGKPDHNDAQSPESKLMGAQITTIIDKIKMANPETYINSSNPYFLIQHGTSDKLIPTEQSINFSQKLEKVLGKSKVKTTYLPSAEHGDKQFGSKENLSIVFDFLEKKLK